METKDDILRPKNLGEGEKFSPEIFNGKTILVVDDDPYIIKSIVRIIKQVSKSCNVVGADSVQSAIKLIEDGITPDFIVSDMMMGNGTGKDLYDKLKSKKPELAEKMMFMSGGMPDGPIKEFFDQMQSEGRTNEKPFETEIFRNRLINLLSKSISRAEESAAKISYTDVSGQEPKLEVKD